MLNVIYSIIFLFDDEKPPPKIPLVPEEIDPLLLLENVSVKLPKETALPVEEMIKVSIVL